MKKAIIFCSILLVFGACQKASQKESSSNAPIVSKDETNNNVLMDEQAPAQGNTLDAMLKKEDEKLEKPSPSQTATPSVSEAKKPSETRKIIRTADVRFKVDNTEKTTYNIEQISKQFNGFVTKTNLNTRIIEQTDVPSSRDSVTQITQYEVENALTIRIPNQNLDTALLEISRLYAFLDHRNVTADDVTIAHWAAQMKAQMRQKSMQRIQKATDEKGKRLDDIVNAETASVDMNDAAVEQQSENLKKDFDVQYSTLQINIYQDLRVAKTTKANPSVSAYLPSFGYRLWTAFSRGWDLILDVFIGLVTIFPILILGALVFWGFRKFGKQMKGGNRVGV